MTDYKITGMQVRDGRPDANGVTVLANFDYEDGRYSVKGASIVKFHNGDATVTMPMLRKSADVARSFRLTNKTEFHRLRDAAFRAYIALGGDADTVLSRCTVDSDGWPMHPRHPANTGPWKVEAPKPAEPVDKWADIRDKLPLINLPPAIGIDRDKSNDG